MPNFITLLGKQPGYFYAATLKQVFIHFIIPRRGAYQVGFFLMGIIYEVMYESLYEGDDATHSVVYQHIYRNFRVRQKFLLQSFSTKQHRTRIASFV